MSIENIIRAWKDADYRERLSDAERAGLPAHPAGLVELTDADLGNAAGGILTESWCVNSCSDTMRIICSAFECSMKPIFSCDPCL